MSTRTAYRIHHCDSINSGAAMYYTDVLHIAVGDSGLRLPRVFLIPMRLGMRSLLDTYPSLYILMAIFPGGPGLAGTGMSLFWILLGLRTTEVVAKIPPTSHHQHPTFYRPNALPVVQPTARQISLGPKLAIDIRKNSYNVPHLCSESMHFNK